MAGGAILFSSGCFQLGDVGHHRVVVEGSATPGVRLADWLGVALGWFLRPVEIFDSMLIVFDDLDAEHTEPSLIS